MADFGLLQAQFQFIGREQRLAEAHFIAVEEGALLFGLVVGRVVESIVLLVEVSRQADHTVGGQGLTQLQGGAHFAAAVAVVAGQGAGRLHPLHAFLEFGQLQAGIGPGAEASLGRRHVVFGSGQTQVQGQGCVAVVQGQNDGLGQVHRQGIATGGREGQQGNQQAVRRK